MAEDTVPQSGAATDAVVDFVFAVKYSEAVESMMLATSSDRSSWPRERCERAVSKLINLRRAVELLWNGEIQFDVDGVLRIHNALMQGILSEERLGFRKGSAGAGSRIFASHRVVRLRTDLLLKFAQHKISAVLDDKQLPKEDKFIRMFAIAAWVMREFLEIHPFSNGNGRTARLIFSLLLKPLVPIPISMFEMDGVHSGSMLRSRYLDSLTAVVADPNVAHPPLLFVRYSYSTVRKFLSNIIGICY